MQSGQTRWATERPIGRTNLRVPALGFGGATLGDARGSISEEQAQATLEGAYAAGIRFFDTAPWYGNGKSELRFGAALRAKPRASFILSTKVGRVYSRCRDKEHRAQTYWRGGLPFNPVFDYTRDGILRGYEQSLLRLGTDRVDALVIHDLDEGHHGTPEGVEAGLRDLAERGGFDALADLKSAGDISAVGAGVNRLGMIPQFLSRFDMDFFLLAMPYTLLSQDALDEELPLCLSRAASVIIGAPFASGVLASGPTPEALYGYRAAPEDVLKTVRGMAAVAESHGVPLGAAALQFPFGHPSVVSVIPGPNSPEQVQANLRWMGHRIPAQFWDELKHLGLLRRDAPVPAAADENCRIEDG